MAEKIKQVKPEDLVVAIHSNSIIKRYPLNPIFTSENVPYPSVIAYNAGVIKYQGQYVMVFRNNVIFPGGLIVEDNGEVKIYYGAADTVECLATTQLDDLIDFVMSFK
jgi:beta-1,4-mannooligosaccharide/beta-1,4-mannosyl-N-acetylglucosamine phosphorylase